ncbi:MAG: hypothetical protein ACPHEP_04195 [Acidimicrobiales bacterium]
MSNRVAPYPAIPADIDPVLRRALVDIFRSHASQINWATGQDVERLTSTGGVAADLVLVDATSAPVTCQLPKASDWRDRVLRIKKTDSSVNAVTITPAGSETIDGGASASISAQNVCLQAMSDGAAWYLVGEYVP